VPGAHEMTEFEKAQGHTEYQDNSRSPVLTPTAQKEMKQLNRNIGREGSTSPQGAGAQIVRTEEDDIVTNALHSPRSGTTFPERAPSPGFDGGGVPKNLNNTFKDKTSSQPNLLKLAKNSEEGSQGSPKHM